MRVLKTALILSGIIFLTHAAVPGSQEDTGTTSPAPIHLNHNNQSVICYISAKAGNKNDFSYNLLDNHLPCTHVIYQGARIKNDSGVTTILDFKTDFFNKRISHAKILLSTQGGGDEIDLLNIISADPERRKKFISDVIGILMDYKLSGFDLNLLQYPYSYPHDRQVAPELITLVQELSKALKTANQLLTVTVGAMPDLQIQKLDVVALSKDVDLLNLMCFSFNGPWSGATGPNAPMKYKEGPSVDSTIKHVLSLGVPNTKLVLGIAMFGYQYTLDEEEAILEPADHFIIFTLVDKDAQPVGYATICAMLKSTNNTWHSWDYFTQTPYAQSFDQWFSYEDVRSVTYKVQYAIIKRLAGVAAWTLDLDDYRGTACSSLDGVGTPFVLVSSINKALLGGPYDVTELDGGDPEEQANNLIWYFIFLPLAALLVSIVIYIVLTKTNLLSRIATYPVI